MHLVCLKNRWELGVFSILLLILNTTFLWARSYYISHSGNDINDGSLNNPYLTLTYALTKVVAGDTIFVMQGTYTVSAPINFTQSGNPISRIVVANYSSERPLFDFSTMPFSSSNRGFQLKGNYWHIKGIQIKGAGDNGMNISGSNNIVEYCSFFENKDSGLQLGGGASNNNIINCDSYYNADPGQGNADGFAPKLDVGTGNYFYGCRAWQNSDDGWDGYLRGADDVTTTIEKCWVFRSGYLKSGLPSSGNGNGFKMGGSDDKQLMNNCILKNCIAFDNRVKGFDQNNNRGSMTIYNCTAYRNGINYYLNSAVAPQKTTEIKNCISYENTITLADFVIQRTNSWLFGTQPNAADFSSLDTLGVTGPRNADGSLPELSFLHLSSASKYINAGTDVGILYKGLAPDLGAFEFDSPVAVDEGIVPSAFRMEQNYPNPFNPVTTIKYTVPFVETLHATSLQHIILKVYDLLGREIITLVNGVKPAGVHSVQFNANNLPSGIYIYIIQIGSYIESKKMILQK